MALSKKAQDAIDKIVERFKDPSSMQNVARAFGYTLEGNWTSTTYSGANKNLILAQTDTLAVRTYKQWQAEGFKVKPGERAAWVWQPLFRKVPLKDKNGNKKDADGNDILVPTMIGFSTFTVFAADAVEPQFIPEFNRKELPFETIAERLGLSVAAAPLKKGVMGYYQSGTNKIVLGTTEPEVWLHELSHAIHDKVQPRFKQIPSAQKEMVAEFSAAVLMQFLGLPVSKNVYDYCEHYAALYEQHTRKIKRFSDVPTIIGNLQVIMKDVTAILEYIFDGTEETKPQETNDVSIDTLEPVLS